MKTFGSLKAVESPLAINAVVFSEHLLSGLNSPKYVWINFYGFLGHQITNCQRTLAWLKGVRVRENISNAS